MSTPDADPGPAAGPGGSGVAAPAAAGDGGARRAGTRELGTVVGLCAVGGGLAVFAAGRPWLRVTAERRPPLSDVSLALSGRDLEPMVLGLGVVGLAGVLGLLATRRWGRLAVAAVIALSGLGVLVGALGRLGPPGPEEILGLLDDNGRVGGVAAGAALTAATVPGWPLLAAAGGLLLAVGGVLALLRSRHWPTMSSRYENPAGRRRTARPRTDAALWDAMDRGDDPTTGDPVAPDPSTGDPVAPDPSTGDPVAPDPSTADPAAPDPSTADPADPRPDAGRPPG